MFRTFLIRLWQRLKPKKNIAKANDVEAVEFRKFYQKELVEACRALGYDIQLVEDEPKIDRMNSAVWVGTGAERLNLGTNVSKEDLIATFKAPKSISMSEHIKANPELYEAHQAVVDDCLKHLDR